MALSSPTTAAARSTATPPEEPGEVDNRLWLLDLEERHALMQKDFVHANRLAAQRLRLKEQLRLHGLLEEAAR